MRLICKRFEANGETYICTNADRLEREDSLVYAYVGSDLVAVISVGSFDTIYLSEEKK